MQEFSAPTCTLDDPSLLDDVVEIPLLLSQQQMLALETAAHAQGLTAAAMVRHLLGRFLEKSGPMGADRPHHSLIN